MKTRQKTRRAEAKRAQPNPKSQARLIATIAAVLILITVAAYWQAPNCRFISCFDDQFYVTHNADVARGLSLPSIGWAFKTFCCANWHPLTWISLMAERVRCRLACSGVR